MCIIDSPQWLTDISHCVNTLHLYAYLRMLALTAVWEFAKRNDCKCAAAYESSLLTVINLWQIPCREAVMPQVMFFVVTEIAGTLVLH